jgi:hypothetical protein
LLLNEQYNLQFLEKEKRNLEAKNYDGYNVVYWRPPTVIPSESLREWYSILSKLKDSKDNVMYFISKLNKIHYSFVKDYNLERIPGLRDIMKQIENVNKKKHQLEIIDLQRQYERLELERKRKYGTQPLNIPSITIYPRINEEIELREAIIYASEADIEDLTENSGDSVELAVDENGDSIPLAKNMDSADALSLSDEEGNPVKTRVTDQDGMDIPEVYKTPKVGEDGKVGMAEVTPEQNVNRAAEQTRIRSQFVK